MPACPTDEELRRYLDRDDPALGDDRRRAIDGHVGTCGLCRDRLERWVRDVEAGLCLGERPSTTGLQGAARDPRGGVWGGANQNGPRPPRRNGTAAATTGPGTGCGTGVETPSGPAAESVQTA